MASKKSMSKKTEPLHARDFEHMNDDAIFNQVKLDKDASEAFQGQYFTKFDELYKLYRSYIDANKQKVNRSNLFIPYSYHVIETVTPKLVLSIFKSRPYVQTVPLGIGDKAIRERRANKMNKLLDYQFQQKIKLIQIATDAIKNSMIYGTAITKQVWSFRTKKMVKRRQKLIAGKAIPGLYEDVLVESVVADDPKVIVIPLKDFLFDPASTNVEEGRYAIHRYWEDYADLVEKDKQAKGLYKNLDKLKDSIGNEESANARPMLDNIGISAGTHKTKDIEIWEYWTDDWVVKIANGSIVIYVAPHPYFHRKKPFAVWKDNPVPNEFYGIGELEPMESLQEELNTTRNQRIDNVSFVLNKMWKIVRGANIDTKQLVSRPAGFIEVDDLNDIEEIEFSDVTASAYNEESMIKDDIDRTTGVHDTERGTTPTRRETATTMSILANAGGERFNLKTLLTEYGGMHEMVNQIIALDQQYIDRPREILILGDDGTIDNDEITPEEILGGWSIVGVGSAIENSANKEWRQQQLVQLFGMVGANQFVISQINMNELLRAIFEAFDMRNIDKILAPQTPTMSPMSPMGMGIPSGTGGMNPQLAQILGGMMNGQGNGNPTPQGNG